jgi:hypothetical protein
MLIAFCVSDIYTQPRSLTAVLLVPNFPGRPPLLLPFARPARTAAVLYRYSWNNYISEDMLSHMWTEIKVR